MNFSDVPYRFFSQHLIVDGIRVAYVDVNPGGPDPVVFLHDVAGDLDDFGDAYEIASSIRRAIGVDLIGFGKSDKPRLDDAVGVNASVVVGLLDALDVERAALVGHGYGARVAARIAAERPERVERVVLSAPPGARELTPDERATALGPFGFDRVLRLDAAGRRAWYEAMVASWNERLDARLWRHGELAKSIQFRLWAHAVEDAVEAVLARNALDDVSKIAAPALVVWGADDPVAPIADAASVRDAIEGSRFAMIEACGHMPALERPEPFVGAIFDFLTGVKGYTGELVPTDRAAADLEPWPGLSPEIGRLARALFEQRERCGEIASALGPDEVAWRPSPRAEPAGTLLLAMGASAVRTLYEELRGEPIPEDLRAKYRIGAVTADDAPRKSGARLVAEIELAHARLLEWLKTRSDADLNRSFASEEAGEKVTLRLALWRLVGEASHLRGQLDYLVRLLPNREPS